MHPIILYIVSAGGVFLFFLPYNNYAQIKDTLPISDNSTEIKKPNPHPFSTSGRISAGYEYGIIPLTADSVYPSGYFKSEGSVDFQVFRMPFIFQHYYTSLVTISGLNNYFRISYNDAKYRESLNIKNSFSEFGITEKIHIQEINLQSAQQKLLYLKSLNGDFEIPGMPDLADSIRKPSYNWNISVPDSLKNKQSFNKPEFPKQKLNKDSISQEIQKIERIIKKYNEEIKTLNEKFSAIQKVKKKGKKFMPEHPGYHPQDFSLRKFEIGLCYPAYSTFLINGSAVNGVNLEMESDKYYVAVTYGKTMNNMQVSRNVILNSLQNVRNLFNYFDFTEVSESKRIAAVKLGVGKKENTHFYVGLLQGKGLVNYLQATNHPEHPGPKENNYVIEMDGRVVFNSNNNLDLLYGKSSLQSEDENISFPENGFLGIAKKIRSHAAKINYQSKIPLTKTEVTLSTRWVDPFFKSYGVGFIRSDNVRYEIKISQPVSSKIKLTTFYRRENDNLMSLYDYTNILNSWGNTLQWKASRSVTIKCGYTPVFQKVIDSEQKIIFMNDNHISNIFITYAPRLKVNTTFTALANYYKLTSQNKQNDFKNYSFTNVTLFNEKLGNTLSASWFFANSTDSIQGHTAMLEDELSWTIRKEVTFSVGIKLAKKDSDKEQFGYSAKVYVPLYKHLAMEGGFEKVIFGDFYNNDLLGMNSFPYLISGKLILFW